MKKIFVLLGGNKLNYGVYEKYKKRGYDVYVVDWNENPFIKGDKHFQIDVKDYKKVCYVLMQNGFINQISATYTSIDKAVKTAVEIEKKIGLLTPDDRAIDNVSSKKKMTTIWNENGLLNREVYSFSTFDKAIIELNKRYKLIFKPDDSASSRGITVLEKFSNVEDLENAFRLAQNESSDGIVLIEEYAEGIEYTAEMIGDNKGDVTVYGISKKSHSTNAGKNRISVKLHYNCIHEELGNSIANFAIKCYKSLGLSNSLGHLELIVKENGIITPLEIAARSSGFIASDLVDIVSGKDFLQELYEVKKGRMLSTGLTKQTNKSSVFYFYDFPSGMEIKNEYNILDFMDQRIISRYFDRTNIKIGHRFKTITSDNDRHGYEILEGPKELLTTEYVLNCEKKMMLNMED